MNAKAVELILLRQLLSRLPLSAALVDAAGDIVYLNPATERLLGYDFAEMGEIPLDDLQDLLDPRAVDGSPMNVREMPIAVAFHQRRPQQYRMIVHGRDGAPRRILTTAIPIDGQGGTPLGSMSFFWEDEERTAAAVEP